MLYLASMKFARNIHEKMKEHVRLALPAGHEPLWKRLTVWLLLSFVALAVAGFFILTLLIAVMSIGLPDVRNFDELAGTESTIIFDRDGGILYTIHGEENRKYVLLNEISPFLQKATIAIEDDEFYSHSGFDIPGLTKAALYELFGIGVQRGGSTITQQLAKNAFLTRKRSYIRKLKELIISIRLERAYEKDKILELYLNRIPYGSNAYGAELAAKMYFGKSASELDLAESAILASLPQAPSYYSPHGPHVYSELDAEINPENFSGELPKTIQDLNENDYTKGLIGRKIEFSATDSLYLPGRTDVVLARMQELEFITEEEKQAALKKIQDIDFQKYKETIRAAHFVFYIRQQLEEMFGKDVVAQGGLQVYTTLDPKLQSAAEEYVTAQIEISKKAHGVSTAALLSVETKTGQILSMVGSADFFDEEAHGNVNHVFAKRQPGSSFKPIVYAKAFLNRYSPATVIYDTPVNFGNNYKPKNYDGTFQGPMTIRRALGQSRNIPALKTYFLAGQENEIVELARKLGIESLNIGGNYGPPLAIGAGEVRLSEMVQAFSVFAAGGIKREHYAILKVVDREGDTLYDRNEKPDKSQEVLDPQVAYLINDVLSDSSVNLGMRLNLPGHDAAVKTGTSNKEITPVKILPSNLWTIGYTPHIVTGVWAGNSDGTPTSLNADGYNVAAPIWQNFMIKAHEGREREEFARPEGIKTVVVSKASGKLPSADTPEDGKVSELFASFSVPTEIDDIYKQVEVNERDNLLPNEYTPKEYIKKKVFMNHHDPITDYPSWLSGIREWIAETRKDNPAFPDFPPKEVTTQFDATGAAGAPVIQILSPAAFSTISGKSIFVKVQVDASHGVEKVLYFLDDRETASAVERKPPYKGKILFGSRTEKGQHTITARVYDKLGYTNEAKVQVQLEKD